jgi:hypothetical protein
MGRIVWCCHAYRAGRFEPAGPDACGNGIRIGKGLPEQVFVLAWNTLVSNYGIYAQEWLETVGNVDVLQRYRARELMRLVKETGCIDSMPYELMLKVLDHIVVNINSKFEVVLLAGIRIQADIGKR